MWRAGIAVAVGGVIGALLAVVVMTLWPVPQNSRTACEALWSHLDRGTLDVAVVERIVEYDALAPVQRSSERLLAAVEDGRSTRRAIDAMHDACLDEPWATRVDSPAG